MRQVIISLFLSMVCAASYAQTTYPVIRPLLKNEKEHSSIVNAVRGLKFENATSLIDKAIMAASKKKESTDELEKLQEYCNEADNSLHGTERVVIVDSVVVDKKDFLSRYPISEELGVLSFADNGETVQLKTQLNGMVLKPMKQDTSNGKHWQITRGYEENGKIAEASPILGLDVDGDLNYPYLMPDGMKFYFAARSSEGLGNYDLYVTRYDSDEKRFYKAENMGFPYNSYANDYMLVIDEENSIGWFASDRYQPAGKVCIYTFVPNESRHTYDYESTNIEKLRNYASLRSVKSLIASYSKEDKAKRDSAIERIASRANRKSSVKTVEFEFIVSDNKVYHSLSDFRVEKARTQCAEWQKNVLRIESIKTELDKMRDKVNAANKAQIINLEGELKALIADNQKLVKEIRKSELGK